MNTKKMTIVAMLASLAYVLTLISKYFFPIPLVGISFLTYDPKDVAILLGGFIFGPIVAGAISLIVSTIQFITVGTTGGWGYLMDLLASMSFVIPASFIYRRRRNTSGVIIGLVSGIVCCIAIMIPANILITPFYTGWSQDKVINYLLPAIIPFNLIKTVLTSSIVLIIYKKIVKQLRLLGLLKKENAIKKEQQNNYLIPIIAIVFLIGCIIIVCQLQK